MANQINNASEYACECSVQKKKTYAFFNFRLLRNKKKYEEDQMSCPLLSLMSLQKPISLFFLTNGHDLVPISFI